MFNKRGLGKIPRKENSFNQDQINLTPLLANQVSLIVQVNYIDLLKSWFHWKKQQQYIGYHGYEIIHPESVRHLPPPPPPTTHPPKKSSDLHESHGWSRAGLGGARAPPVATPLAMFPLSCAHACTHKFCQTSAQTNNICRAKSVEDRNCKTTFK